jgi:hypothetical protein
MPGLGRRTFAPGEVLTATNVMGYLQDQAIMNFAGTAARGSAIGTAVAQGMVSYLDDSDTIETYNGTTWLRQTAGLIPVRPTSVVPVGAGSSASSNALGLVTYSSCTSVQLAGVFSSRFRNYQIVIDNNAASNTGNGVVFLRLGNGTTFSAASYGGGFNGIEAGFTATTNVNSADSVPMVYIRDNNNSAILANIYRPFTSQSTPIWGGANGYAPGNTIIVTQFSSLHNVSTSYSALQLSFFSPTSGNISGTIQVFGYNN